MVIDCLLMETSTDTSSADLESCKLVTLPLPYKSLYSFVLTWWSNIVAFFGLITLKIDTLPYFKAPFQAAPMDIRLLLFPALYQRDLKHRIYGKQQTWDSSLRANSPIWASEFYDIPQMESLLAGYPL